MKTFFNYRLIFPVLLITFGSCRSQKDIIYFQEIKKGEEPVSRIEWKNFPSKDTSKLVVYEPIIQPNDILKIYITSINKEASSFFNPLLSADLRVEDPQATGYLVDSYGMIDLPVIGSFKVAGMTVPQIRDSLKIKLSKYLENPSVRVIFDNFKITILGEVQKPGVYSVRNERLTLPEALGLAGDMTIYGNRKTVLLIREEKQKRNFIRIDLTDRSFFDSPYYFLNPNDVIYIEPGRGKTAASDNFYRIAPIVISTLTLFTLFLVRFQN